MTATHPAHMLSSISEIALTGLSLISLAVTPLVLSEAPTQTQEAFNLQWFLLPLVGSLCSSVCSMLLNPHPEARKTVLARCIFGVVSGTAIPKIISMIHPALKEWSLDPAFAFLGGFSICLVAYVCARPLVEKLFARSGDYADAGLELVEKRVEHVTKTEVRKETVTTAPAAVPVVSEVP